MDANSNTVPDSTTAATIALPEMQSYPWNERGADYFLEVHIEPTNVVKRRAKNGGFTQSFRFRIER